MGKKYQNANFTILHPINAKIVPLWCLRMYFVQVYSEKLHSISKSTLNFNPIKILGLEGMTFSDNKNQFKWASTVFFVQECVKYHKNSMKHASNSS